MEALNHFSLFKISVLLFFMGLSSLGLYLMLKVSIKKRWFDIPIDRSSHSRIVPRTAGIVIGILTLVALIFFGPTEFKTPQIFLSLFIFLTIGIYDDIKHLKASTKFWVQLIVCVGLAVMLPNFRINHFYGVLGLNEISEAPSILFTSFVFIVVINAYNLIDGIDGLAASFSIFSIYLLSSLYTDFNQDIAFFGLIVVGILIPFFFFNFSSSRKMFLGDTGSLFLGTTIVLLVGYFLNTKHAVVVPCGMNRAIYVLVALCYPLLDTLRVFIIRITLGQSPFLADRSHLHHKLLGLGLNHYTTTITLVTFNALIYFVNCVFLNGIEANAVIVADFLLIGFFFIAGLWYTRFKRTLR